jgi:parvulin-like peptidyl-prolyl isomerase
MAIRHLSLILCAAALASVPLASAAPRSNVGTASRTGRTTRVATKPPITSPRPEAAATRTGSGVAATVNGEPITETEWLGRLRLMAGKNALDNLIREKVLRQEARKHAVTVSAAEIASKAKEFEKGYRERSGSPEKFNDFLKQQGLSLASFQSAMRYSAEMQAIQQKLMQKIGEKLEVADKELLDTYEKQKFQFTEPAQVKFAHILLNFSGVDEAAQNKTKEEAQALLQKLKAPQADFAALAKEFSQDPDSKDKGGELSWMTYSPWGPPFDQVVMAAPVGLMDQPVRSFKGYHIVKVLDKKPQRTRPFEEVKNDLRARLLDQRRSQQYREYMQNAEKTAKTEVKLQF